MEDNHARGERSFLEEMEPYLAGNDAQRVLELAQVRLSKIPEDIGARVAICRALLMQGRDEEAWRMVAEIEGRLSGLVGLYASMGDLCSKKGLDTEAEVFYRKYAALHPEAPLDRNIHSDNPKEPAALQEREECDEGEEESGISAEFETATLAELYMRQGHIEQAQEMLEKITARDPSNERARLLLERVRALPSARKEEQKNAVIVATLERWLGHVERLRCHA
jgi:tetratricopeptide (TPR) repeat protein